LSKAAKARQQLLDEIESLHARLSESEETLRAIREGEVDAIVVNGSQGEQVFSPVGSESVYRLIVETMKEAALTVSFDGRILYCNAQFGEMIRRPIDRILGHPLQEFVWAQNRAAAEALLEVSRVQPVRQRLVFQDLEGATVPAQVASAMNQPGKGVHYCFDRDPGNGTSTPPGARGQRAVFAFSPASCPFPFACVMVIDSQKSV
jgi:PAS domain S-box-containing protein